jgi:phosphoglycerate dehydrogenase-like enzyme
MKITVLAPRKEFSRAQQKALKSLGQVVYTKERTEYPISDLIKLAEGSQILAADPDILGGFEKAKTLLTKLMDSLPSLKGLALETGSFEWVDLDYCRQRGIVVTNAPGGSTESVAEHVLGLLVCLSKKIIVSDRRTQKGQYQLELGSELKDKTLGIIGLGHIGRRVAQLGQAVGMKVIAWNRTPKNQKGVEFKSFNKVLHKADFISINLEANQDTYHFISEKEIGKMKKGVIVVNLIGPVPQDREVVDTKAMVKALKNGIVSAYAYEAEDLVNNPLNGLENAIGLKPFAWYTKEALERATQIWTENIIGLGKGKSINRIS